MRMGKFDLKDKSEQGFIKYAEHAHNNRISFSTAKAFYRTTNNAAPNRYYSNN